MVFVGMFISTKLFCQKDVSNGVYLSPKGDIRVLMVFAEINWGDSSHVVDGISFGDWVSGQLPPWSRTLYDTVIQTPQINQTSKYFEELSFGEYHVVAGYHKDLVWLQLSDFFDTNGTFVLDDSRLHFALENKLKNMPLNSSGGNTLGDYDLWTPNSNHTLKTLMSNSMIDHLMIFVRNHPFLKEQSGSTGNFKFLAFGDTAESVSIFSANNLPLSISRHEFAHGIFGANDYHTVGKPGGNWAVMWASGGYSALASDGGLNTQTANAFDRYWVKYKPASNNYQISARAIDGTTELNTQLDSFKLDAANPSGEYILRNFWSSGDAIRIKLPYLPPTQTETILLPNVRTYVTGSPPAPKTDTTYVPVKATYNNQYLWIENRQTDSSPFSLNSGSDEGIYAYIQVGRDFNDPDKLFPRYPDTSGVPYPALLDSSFAYRMNNRVSVGANYLHFLPSVGKYDYSYTYLNPTENNHVNAVLLSELANPFTGFHHLMQPAWDFNADNHIHKGEGVSIKEITSNGSVLPTSNFVDYSLSATAGIVNYDAFTPAPSKNKIGISHNPAAVPILTHNMHKDENNIRTTLLHDRASDNRIVHLNGISVEVLEQRANGDIKVKVRFDDYNITQDARWCAETIKLHEMVFVDSGATLTIDRGLMPQRNTNPVTINGKKAFSDPTTFIMEDGSKFQLNPHGKAILKNQTGFIVKDGTIDLKENSEMTLEGNSTLTLESGRLTINDGAHLLVKAGSSVEFQSIASLSVRSGGKITIEQGAELIIKSDGITGGVTLGDIRSPAAPPTTAYPAEILVYGTLTFDNIDWKHNGHDGFYHFTNGSQLNITAGKEVELIGHSENTKILEIDYANFQLDLSSFKVQDAQIKLNNSASLIIDNASVDMQNVKQVGGSILLDAPASFIAKDYTAEYAVDALTIKNAGTAAGRINIRDSYFLTCSTSVTTDNVDDLYVYNTDMSGVGTGIKASNCRIVTYHGDMDAGTGADLENVPGFYVTGSQTVISALSRGIKGVNAQVFLRNGAEVMDAEVGVELSGSYVSGAYTSMLTVGDVGCGSIINNSNFFQGPKNGGIWGNDLVLNIDANLHAMARTSNARQPNSFYGNYNNFDVCYNDSTVAPGMIMAQGNWWNGGNLRNYSKICHGYCRVGEQKSCDYLGVDTTDQSLCAPVNNQCHSCGSKDLSVYSDFSRAIVQAYRDVYSDFSDTDYYDNRVAFAGLSQVAIQKAWEGEPDENGQIPVQWYVDYQNDLYPIEEMAAHAVQVARVIYAGRVSPVSARLKAPKPVDIFEEYFEDKSLNVQIIPNPAQYQVKVNVWGKDLHKYRMNIYNSMGELVYQKPYFIDVVSFPTSQLGKMGIYFVEVISLEKDKRTVEKLIVEK
jgi:hypothetical protein